MLIVSKVFIDAHHLDTNCRNKRRDRSIRPLGNYASYVMHEGRISYSANVIGTITQIASCDEAKERERSTSDRSLN